MTHSVACTYKWIGKKGGTEFHEIGVWLYCLYTSPVVIYGRGLRDSEMLLLEFRELALADTHTRTSLRGATRRYARDIFQREFGIT